MEEKKKSKPSLRAKADRIRDFRCKNLIAVIEHPNDLRNIGTIIRNVNALGVEKAYIVTEHESIPDDWQEMRSRRALNAISASAIKWSFVKKFRDTESCLAHLERKGFISVITSPHTKGRNTVILHEADRLLCSMAHNLAFSMAILVGSVTGCSGSERTVLVNWNADRATGDSVAAAFTSVLGDAPDSLQRCSPKRMRLSFVNRPGAFPITGRMEGKSFVQSGPSAHVEFNLARAIAYASREPLERFGIDTLVVTLTRSSRSAGSHRASYQVTLADMSRGTDWFTSYSVPVTATSPEVKPCGPNR